jgi:anti-anti-sigma regulatory factor
MLLRITREDSGTLRLEGRVVQPFMDLLERECSGLFGVSVGVTLDLSGVTLVDREGIETLKRLQRRGAVLRGCSDAVASVLEAEDIDVERDGLKP